MFSHPPWKGLEEKTVIAQLPAESITPLQHPVLHRVAYVIPFGSGPLGGRGHHYPMSKEAKHGEISESPVAVLPRLGEGSHLGQPGTLASCFSTPEASFVTTLFQNEKQASLAG